MTTTVAAVDLGASSGRVFVGIGDQSRFELHEVHRFPNQPVSVDGTLRWNIHALFQGTLDGLRVVGQQTGRLDGIGVDGWGVDYGLLDADGKLLADPVHYRDRRTEPAVAAVLDEIGAEALYAATGTQLQPFNTLFQFRADADTAVAAVARRALLVPDLISYWLTGAMGTELTNASTTGLLDPRTLDWAQDLAERLRMPLGLFAPLRRSGVPAGRLRAEVAAGVRVGVGVGAGAVPVLTVPSHDTAAAVAGVPAATDDFAYVCTGTWALVGLELPGPVITEASRRANFTNEVGVDGTIRFLRNVTGFWLLQECVRFWESTGNRVELAEVTAAAATRPALRAVIDVQEPAFAAPGDMPARIAAAARFTSGAEIASPAEITRCILDSMALAVRDAVRAAAILAARTVRVVHVVGGGVSNELFCQLVADACGLTVLAGPVEAASWGNILAQARALGCVGDSLAEARRVVAESVSIREYRPVDYHVEWDRAAHLVERVRAARA